VTTTVGPNQSVWHPYATGRQSAMPDEAEPPTDEHFRAEAKGDDNDTVITVNGELDASGTEWFAACVSALLERHPTSITIDARGLSFMDSSGLRSMLTARAAADLPAPLAREGHVLRPADRSLTASSAGSRWRKRSSKAETERISTTPLSTPISTMALRKDSKSSS
jgi:STAS domain